MPTWGKIHEEIKHLIGNGKKQAYNIVRDKYLKELYSIKF